MCEKIPKKPKKYDKNRTIYLIKFNYKSGNSECGWFYELNFEYDNMTWKPVEYSYPRILVSGHETDSIESVWILDAIKGKGNGTS